jgi:hypothetical protein
MRRLRRSGKRRDLSSWESRIFRRNFHFTFTGESKILKVAEK